MATPPVVNKSSSRWGSFLQQAVAGVESRLDTILADEDSNAVRPTKPNEKAVEQPAKREAMSIPTPQRSSMDGISRTSSNSKNSDRLQERLAKALANRSGTKLDGASTTSSALPSRTASPSKGFRSPRASSDLAREDNFSYRNGQGQAEGDQTQNNESVPLGEVQTSAAKVTDPPALLVDHVSPESPSMDSQNTHSTRPSMELPRRISNISETPSLHMGNGSITSKTPTQYEEEIGLMRSDYESAELRRQEETHQYLERIDALQSKLQYLTKEAAEIARKASSEAEAGSADQKLAEKDEKIALLLQEGQKLSQNELKHMTTIKKLRAKSADDEKRVAELKKTAEKQEKAAREAQERARRAEIAEKRELERIKSLQRVERDLENVKAESDGRASKIIDLESQLANVRALGEAEDLKTYKSLLESEKRMISELRDDLSNAKIEKELSEDRHRAQMRDLEKKFAGERDRSKVTEMELRGELGVLESRLETLRARAEEASSGSVGDTQAKLLRQIETLQSQYSVASENWQGIEGSLLARVTSLERERDDISKREADVRRKAREASIKARRLEEDLEKTTTKIQSMEAELVEQRTRLATLHEHLTKAENEATHARAELKTERETWEARLANRREEEKAEQREYNVHASETTYQHFHNESPITKNRQKSNADRSPHYRRHQSSSGLGLTGAPLPFPERPVSRRASGLPLQTSGFGTPYRQDSLTSTPQLSVNGGIPETPSLQTDQQDDFFDGVVTPATPERTINDMISVSTAGAGPSVQLVERMSAAVRRLESEKAMSKDELSRLSAQRDEARDQVVALMREVDEKRAADEKIKALEAEVSEINQRYQTTAEMLGEKIELVDELRADVADVKQMYRELVDSTMR